MPHRTHPGLLLPRSPLLVVLAVIEIGPILSMEGKIPQVQEALRKQGFPNFETARTTETQLHIPDGQSLNMSMRNRVRWEFINQERTLSVRLDERRIILLSSSYQQFEGFLETLKVVMGVVQTEIQPSLVQALSLRYVDLIDPRDGHLLEQYVSPSLRGPASATVGRRSAFLSQSFIATGPESLLVVRFAESERGFAFPPDLLPLSLHIPHSLHRDRPFGLLDLDHSTQMSSGFEPDAVIETLWTLHRSLDTLFRECTTEMARSEWAYPVTRDDATLGLPLVLSGSSDSTTLHS
jgi:uncharacterized protein (TIGR04255 family)